MDIPTEQLNHWAQDLGRQISAIREQIDLLQGKLVDLERKKTAIDCLTRVNGNEGDKTLPSFAVQPSSTLRRPPAGSLPGQRDHAAYTAYWAPILEVLIDLGGKGHVEEVLPKVKQKMEAKSVLGPLDYHDVPSGTEEYWRNTARWQRKAMVDRGLLRSGSPRGIWEVTQEGREWFTKNRAH